MSLLALMNSFGLNSDEDLDSCVEYNENNEK